MIGRMRALYYSACLPLLRIDRRSKCLLLFHHSSQGDHIGAYWRTNIHLSDWLTGYNDICGNCCGAFDLFFQCKQPPGFV